MQEGSGQSVLLHIPHIEHLGKDRMPAQPAYAILLTTTGAEVSLIFMPAIQALMCLASHRPEVKGITAASRGSVYRVASVSSSCSFIPDLHQGDADDNPDDLSHTADDTHKDAQRRGESQRSDGEYETALLNTQLHG